MIIPINKADGSGVVTVEINFTDKYLEEKYGAPATGSAGAAAVDLRACPIQGEDPKTVHLWAGQEYTYSAGFKMRMPRGLAAVILPRSGLGWKGINLANSVDLITSDDQDEIMVELVNNGVGQPATIWINPYDRIAQMIFIHSYEIAWQRVAQFREATDRGEGGFGSSGVE